MTRLYRARIPLLAVGLLLVTFDVAAAEQKEVAAADILDFCTAALPEDAARKAKALGWHPAADKDVAGLRPLVDPLEKQPKNIQAWQRGSTPQSGLLLYANAGRTNDGSFVSALKSFLPRKSNCAYVGVSDAAALKNALTARLGVSPSDDLSEAPAKKTSTWQTSALIATLSEISLDHAPRTVAVVIIPQ